MNRAIDDVAVPERLAVDSEPGVYSQYYAEDTESLENIVRIADGRFDEVRRV